MGMGCGYPCLTLLNLPLLIVSDQYHAILTRRLTPILTQPHVQRKNFSTHLVKPGLFPCASRNSGNARWHTLASKRGTITGVLVEPLPFPVDAQRCNAVLDKTGLCCRESNVLRQNTSHVHQ